MTRRITAGCKPTMSAISCGDRKRLSGPGTPLAAGALSAFTRCQPHCSTRAVDCGSFRSFLFVWVVGHGDLLEGDALDASHSFCVRLDDLRIRFSERPVLVEQCFRGDTE